ncbi:MAG: hypothetical protein K6B40_05270 [Firmicutes bacterium]|nr:hypothetical protein [Bacillota bacterium]
MKALDIALTVMSVLFVGFTAAVLLVYWHTGSEPAVLVGGWCASVLGEIVACTKIKLGKERKEHRGE